MIRVLIAEDQALVRAGLKGIVNTATDLTVVGEAGDGSAAVEIAARLAPDVVLMDIRMPGVDGLRATRMITQSSPAKVLVLTTFDLDDYVYAALQGGASGFLLKDTPPAELLAAIRVVAAGDALLGPTITRRLIDDFANRSQPRVRVHLPSITAREREVLLLVADGRSNAEIADALHIEIGTAKTHIAHLLTKLDARDRVQLVILAFRAGLCNG